MFKPDNLITEFDSRLRILHVAYRRRIHPTTKAHLDIVFDTFEKMLDPYFESGRLYLIIDMTNFIVEPNLKLEYVARARDLIEKYIYPDGIARYGFQITRITIRACYDQYMAANPNIFNSREEAYRYIYSLIEMRGDRPQAATAATPTANFSDY